MSDKVQLIKEEIERLDEKYRELRVEGTIQQAKEADLVVHVLQQLNNFINSLPEEPASEDLEEAASKYVREDFHERSRADFKAGAEWHKQQMMKDAVEGEYWIGEIHLDTPIIQGYNDGDRIKFIPIKYKQQ